MSAPTKRRRREVITRSDGSTTKPAKPPRADVLWYPRNRWVTVLVRRTHDVDLACELAEARWAELDDDRPLTGGMRVGWFRTYASRGPVPDNAAEDQLGRVVQVCDDTDRAASPCIEFRP